MRTLWFAARAAMAAAAAAGVAGAATAETWWYVGAGGNSVMIADADSIGGTGESRTVAVRTYRLSDAEPSISGAIVEVECAALRFRYLRLSALTPTLQVAFEGEATGSTHEWRQLSPGNSGVPLVRFACREPALPDFAPVRVGSLAAQPSDRATLARLIAAGVPAELAAPLALGRLASGEVNALLREATPQVAAAVRAAGPVREVR